MIIDKYEAINDNNTEISIDIVKSKLAPPNILNIK